MRAGDWINATINVVIGVGVNTEANDRSARAISRNGASTDDTANMAGA